MIRRITPATILGLMMLLGCSSATNNNSTSNAGGAAPSGGGATGLAGNGSGTSGAGGSSATGINNGGTGTSTGGNVAAAGTQSAGAAGGTAVGGSAGSNTGGVANVGGSGGATGGATTGGTTGSSGSGGSGGAGQQPPILNIDPGRMNRVDTQFNVTDADPTASGFHGGGAEYAAFDGSKTVQGYLVVTMGGIGGGPHNGGAYQWAIGRGFHGLAVDMFNATGGEGNGGKVYLESFSGQDLTGAANVTPQNGVMNRVKTGVAYLATQDIGADWSYYLDGNGEVIWDRVILFGYSYGGQTAVAATKFVAVHRVVATSAPNIPTGEAEASWITEMPNVADVNNCFAINDGEDNFWATLTTMGWIGPSLRVMEGDDVTIPAPFQNTHMLDVPGGHTEFCSLPKIGYDKVCDYAFGVIP